MENIIIDQKKLRQVAGSFATGITVVCTRDESGSIQGMTANSFLSVSLDPPLVLFSVMAEAKFLDYCQKESTVGISILSENQKVISDQFAGLLPESIPIRFEDQTECPLIAGALAWYKVRVEALHEVGDHILVICKVLDLQQNEGNPLLYYRGYKSIGQDQ